MVRCTTREVTFSFKENFSNSSKQRWSEFLNNRLYQISTDLHEFSEIAEEHFNEVDENANTLLQNCTRIRNYAGIIQCSTRHERIFEFSSIGHSYLAAILE